MERITIVGVGHVGRLVLFGLLQHEIRGTINLIDINDESYGYAIDGGHASLSKPDLNVVFNDDALAAQSDYIFHCAGPSVPKGAKRNEILDVSKTVTGSIFQHRSWKPDAKVIVITNPVEPVCRFVSEFGRISPENVFGTGTSIDTLRLRYALSHLLGIDPDRIRTLMIGEHGTGMIPLQSQTFVDDEPFTDQAVWNKAVAEARNAAHIIKGFTGYTSLGPAQVALELWQLLSGRAPSDLPFSAACSSRLIEKNETGPNWFSLPLSMNKRGIEAHLPEGIREAEWEQIRTVSAQLYRTMR